MEPDSTDVGQDLIEQDVWGELLAMRRRVPASHPNQALLHNVPSWLPRGMARNFALGRGTGLICITKETGADIHS